MVHIFTKNSRGGLLCSIAIGALVLPFCSLGCGSIGIDLSSDETNSSGAGLDNDSLGDGVSPAVAEDVNGEEDSVPPSTTDDVDGKKGAGADKSGVGGNDSGVGGDDSGAGGDDSDVEGDDSGVGGNDSGVGGDDSGAGGDSSAGEPKIVQQRCVDDPFMEPKMISGLISGSADKWGPTITGDGLTLYFSALGQGDRSEVLHRSTRPNRDSPFEAAERVVALDGADSEATPFINDSGTRIYFSTQVGSQQSSRDIYFAEYDDATESFGDTIEMTELSSSSQDHLPWLSKDELTILFASKRENTTSTIWHSSRDSTDQAFSDPSLLPGLEAAMGSDDTSPSMSADGLTLYFSSDRSGGGDDDFWTATRETLSDEFSNATKLEGLSSDGTQDLDLRLSADGYEVFFSSNRGGGKNELWMSYRNCTE